MRLGGVAERLARRVTPRKSEKIIVSHCVSTDLLRQHLETPAGDPAPKLLKPGAHALYGLRSGQQRPQPRAPSMQLAGPGSLGHLTSGCRLHFATAAAIAADDVTMPIFARDSEVFAPHHAAVAGKHHAFASEALLKIA
jgi:hypothetical protein